MNAMLSHAEFLMITDQKAVLQAKEVRLYILAVEYNSTGSC